MHPVVTQKKSPLLRPHGQNKYNIFSWRLEFRLETWRTCDSVNVCRKMHEITCVWMSSIEMDALRWTCGGICFHSNTSNMSNNMQKLRYVERLIVGWPRPVLGVLLRHICHMYRRTYGHIGDKNVWFSLFSRGGRGGCFKYNEIIRHLWRNFEFH